MAHLRPSYIVMGKILDAIGMKDKPVRRVVLDFDMDKPVLAYVEYLVAGDCEDIADALKDEQVQALAVDGPMPDVLIDAGIKTC